MPKEQYIVCFATSGSGVSLGELLTIGGFFSLPKEGGFLRHEKLKSKIGYAKLRPTGSRKRFARPLLGSRVGNLPRNIQPHLPLLRIPNNLAGSCLICSLIRDTNALSESTLMGQTLGYKYMFEILGLALVCFMIMRAKQRPLRATTAPRLITPHDHGNTLRGWHASARNSDNQSKSYSPNSEFDEWIMPSLKQPSRFPLAPRIPDENSTRISWAHRASDRYLRERHPKHKPPYELGGNHDIPNFTFLHAPEKE